MDIIFVLKGSLEGLPPMIPRIIHFAKQKDIKVSLICSYVAPSNLKVLESFGVKCYQIKHRTRLFGFKFKILDWLGFRWGCKKILKSLGGGDYIYVCSADTAICLWGIINKFKYVFQANELYDKFIFYKFCIKYVVRNAVEFVVPEFCRANIFMTWYNLKKAPIVIPNIPILTNSDVKQDISNLEAQNIINKLSDKKIILYQGYINSGDRSLSVISRVLKKINNSDFVFVLMGIDQNNSIRQLIDIYEYTYYIPFVTPPQHLEITSHAYIGVLSYDRVSLNNIFCAPNKIYEYSSYGIPMLGNDIPGLRYCIDIQKMGKTVDYNNENKVMAAILEIDANHYSYSANSRSFYAKENLNTMLDNLISILRLN